MQHFFKQRAIVGSSGDPWISLDGRLNAPSGAAQFPTFFSSQSYPTRPPWKVAGVDYRVGINTGVVLKIPGVDTLPAGFVYDPSNSRVHTFGASSGVVLDGWDFTTGSSLWMQPQSDNVVLRNCKFSQIDGSNSRGMTGCLIEYCEITNFTSTFKPAPGSIVFSAGAAGDAASTCTMRYCYVHDIWGDATDASSPSLTLKYNLFKDWAQGDSGVHGDFMQGLGSQVLSLIFEFNTIWWTGPGALGGGGSQGLSVPGSADATMPQCNGGSVSNNSVRNDESSYNNFYSWSAGDVNGTIVCNNNYVDRTHFIGGGSSHDVFFSSGTPGAAGHHNFPGTVTGNGNVNLADGSSFASGTLYSN